MKIYMDKALVEFVPETPAEKTELEALWIKMGNCVGKDKFLAPIGAYEPYKGDSKAQFHIEGLSEEESAAYPEMHVYEDCKVYCVTCNKLIDLKAGSSVPMCCGKPMEIVD